MKAEKRKQVSIDLKENLEKESKKCRIDKLPDEIIDLHIFSKLRAPDLANASSVCKKWDDCAQTDSLWRICLAERNEGAYISRDLPLSTPMILDEIHGPKDFKEAYYSAKTRLFFSKKEQEPGKKEPETEVVVHNLPRPISYNNPKHPPW